MTGKVINKDGELTLLSYLGHLLVHPTNSDDIQKKIKDRLSEENHVWVEYLVDTIADGTSEFDIMDMDVAVILKVYNEDFGTLKESISIATERYENNKYPIGGFAPGNYWHRQCVTCKHEFIGDKRAVQCEPCAFEELIENNI